jgi:hypothetical protein
MIKIENLASAKLPRSTVERIETVLRYLPREHLRGIERIRLVDRIADPRWSKLPGLYHPRQGAQSAWLEIAIGQLLPRDQPLWKRLLPRLAFKNNLAATVISLIGQHYYLTLRHSIKRHQLEPAIRRYTEEHLRTLHEREHRLRARLFKPLQPVLERWARALARRAKQTERRAAS